MDFHHVSVLPEETLNALNITPNGIYVDCTLGGAGHAGRIAARLSPEGRLIGIDQDEAAIAAAQERLADAACQVTLVRDNFRNLSAILAGAGVDSTDGVLFDLGISSPQIDTAERGFSYMQDAPLDMRMDRRAGRSARSVVNEYTAAELTEIFYNYGEERGGENNCPLIGRGAQGPSDRDDGTARCGDRSRRSEEGTRKRRTSGETRLSSDPH